MIYVLDASVILKWFIEEAESKAALNYRQELIDGSASVACPDLTLYEVGNVLSHKKGVTQHALTNALSDLLRCGVDFFTPTEALLHYSAHIVATKKLTFYDAVYVALAHDLDATLVSADNQLCRYAQNVVSVHSLAP